MDILCHQFGQNFAYLLEIEIVSEYESPIQTGRFRSQQVGQDVQQVGLDFKQGGLDFGQGGVDFRQGGLDFQQVGKNIVQICAIKWSKLARFSFDLS